MPDREDDYNRLQRVMDVIGDTPGSLLVRGPDRWITLPPGNIGDLLVINNGGIPEWFTGSATDAGPPPELPRQPLAYWSAYLTPGGSALIDYGRGGNDAAIVTAPYGQVSAYPFPGAALFHWNGSALAAVSAISELQITGDLTLACLVKPMPSARGTLIGCGASGESPDSNFCYQLTISSASAIGSYWEYGNGVNVAVSIPAPRSPDEWVLFGMTRDSAAKICRAYINGQLTGQVGYSHNASKASSGNDQRATIGADIIGGGGYQYGLYRATVIDDAVWSNAEMMGMYNALLGA